LDLVGFLSHFIIHEVKERMKENRRSGGARRVKEEHAIKSTKEESNKKKDEGRECHREAELEKKQKRKTGKEI